MVGADGISSISGGDVELDTFEAYVSPSLIDFVVSCCKFFFCTCNKGHNYLSSGSDFK
jgi:hypothetical protein